MKLPLGLTPNHVAAGGRQLRQGLRKATTIGIAVWALATGLMVLHALGIVPYDVLDLNRIDLADYQRRSIATVRTDDAVGSGFLVDESTLVTSFAALGDVKIGDPVAVAFSWPDPQTTQPIEAKVKWIPDEDSDSEVVIIGFDPPLEDRDTLETSEFQPTDGSRVVVLGFDSSSEQLLEIMAKVLPGGQPYQIEPNRLTDSIALDWPGFAVLSAEDLGVMAVTIGGTSAMKIEDAIEASQAADFGAQPVN